MRRLLLLLLLLGEEECGGQKSRGRRWTRLGKPSPKWLDQRRMQLTLTALSKLG